MTLRITQDSHNKLINLVMAIQNKQRDFTEFREKLETIDIAYAKHEVDLPSTGEGEPDEIAVKVPIVNSEIDDLTSYLTGIFVNQRPLFPVLPEKGKPEDAMKLQALINRDAKHLRWGRQLLKFLSASARYNTGAIEVEYVEQVDVSVETKDDDPAKHQYTTGIMPVTQLKAIDMYNALFDYRVSPADVAFEGDYAGYNQIVSKTALKRLGNTYSKAKTAYNLKEAYASGMEGTEEYWNEKPDIATHITADSATEQEDWFNWIGIIEPSDGKLKLANASYFLTRLYVRIIPSEFGISIPGANNTPTIIKLTVVNNKWIINYQEVITPLAALPILFSDTREDDFAYQTKSAGENVISYQQSATELLHTRLKGSKRALNDRAIYDPAYIDTSKVNSTNPSAKIPLKAKLKASGERPPLNSLYYQIPFESQGTMGAISDLSTVLQIKDQVNGNNFASRGEHKKGNRTAAEFSSLSSKAEGKQLPTAIRIEEQVMIPLKLMIKLNILSSNVIEQQAMDEDSGEVIAVNIAELRKAMLEFKLTDGLRPKTAIQDPEVLSMAIQFIQNSEALNAEYDVSGIFGDLMATLDIDISKHKRKQPHGNPSLPAPTANPADGSRDPAADPEVI